MFFFFFTGYSNFSKLSCATLGFSRVNPCGYKSLVRELTPWNVTVSCYTFRLSGFFPEGKTPSSFMSYDLDDETVKALRRKSSRHLLVRQWTTKPLNWNSLSCWTWRKSLSWNLNKDFNGGFVLHGKFENQWNQYWSFFFLCLFLSSLNRIEPNY